MQYQYKRSAECILTVDYISLELLRPIYAHTVCILATPEIHTDIKGIVILGGKAKL